MEKVFLERRPRVEFYHGAFHEDVEVSEIKLSLKFLQR
jgi:hypothetical protein